MDSGFPNNNPGAQTSPVEGAQTAYTAGRRRSIAAAFLLLCWCAGAKAGYSGNWSGFSGNGNPDTGTQTTIAAGDAALSITTSNIAGANGGQVQTLFNNPLGTSGTAADYSDASVFGRQALRWRFEFGSNTTCPGTATWRVRYGRPVWNPIIHLDRLGGASGVVFDTTVMSFPLPITKLAGQAKFQLASATQVRRQVPVTGNATVSAECLANDPAGSMACGSIRVEGGPVTNLDIGLSHADGSASGFDNACTTGDQIELLLVAFSDVGDAPAGYGSAVHSIRDDRPGGVSGGGTGGVLAIGTLNTDDQDTLSSATATNDNGDDGVTFSAPVGGGDNITATVAVTNTTGAAALLCGWLDADRNGAFDGGERQCIATIGSSTQSFSWPITDTTQQTYYARFRSCTGGVSVCDSPTGAASDGEVEDYAVTHNPTHASIGSVTLSASAVDGYLAMLGEGTMSDTELLALLAAWDADLAARHAAADRAALEAALLAYLDPDGDGQVALLRWDTLSERGTIGFYVERADAGDDDWVQINGDLLPALIDAHLGGEYLLADPEAQSGVNYLYQLIEQEAWGTRRTHGPYELRIQ